MKFKNLFSTAFIVLLSLGLSAQNPYYLFGAMMDTQGNPVANQSVTWWFSPNAPITGGPTGTVMTDANGIFSDSLVANATSGWFLFSTLDCDNSTLTDSVFVQSAFGGGVVQIAMTYCDTGNVSNPPGPCNASFNYVPGTGAGPASFFAVYAEPGTVYYWDFGDGNYDTTTSPITNHAYTGNPGSAYTACLTVVNSMNSCNTTQCLNVTLPGGGGPGTGNAVIGGQIWVGQQLANSAKVYLIDVDTISGQIYLTAVDSMNTTQGIYSFDSIPAGSYIIKAALNSSDPNYANYVPTFAGISSTGPGGALDWYDAVLFGIYPNIIANYTSSVFMVSGTNPGGPGFVSGPVGTASTPQSIVNGFVQSNNGMASSATVYLIEFDTTSGGILTAIDTVQTQNGFYQFDSVPQGWYLVKAALNSNDPDYANYLPTYFGMASGTFFGPTLFWFNAQPVIPTPNAQQVGYGIAMIAGNNPGGPGFVGGLVSQGANKTTGPGDGLENVLVMLLDINEDPIAYTYTNKEGEFGFDNLAYGDYKVYTEVSGIMTTPVNVTIDATNPSVDLVDVIISSNGVNGTVGVRNLSVNKNGLSIYPNPAKEQVNIELEKTGLSTFRILDLTGKEVLNGSSYHDRVSIDLGGLSEGMYIIQLTNNGELFQSKLVKE